MDARVKFDLTFSGDLCDGEIVFRDNTITSSCSDEVIFTASLDNIESAAVRTYVGCGELELIRKNNSDDYCDSLTVCRFSMNCVEEIGELCKVVNHYLKTGEETEIDRNDFHFCPKCGRHYAKGINTCLFCVEKTWLAKRLFLIAKPYLPSLLFAGFFIMLASVASTFAPVLNARLVDNYLLKTGVTTDGAVNGVINTALLLGLSYLINLICNIIGKRRANRISASLSSDLRVMVYDKIQRLSVSSVSRKSSGDLMKRVSSDTERVKNFITEQGLYAVEKLIMFVVILAVLLKVSPLLTLITLIPVPAVIYAMYKFWSRIRVRYGKQWRSESKENSILHDIVRGIRVVKSFGTEEREIAKFSDASKNVARISASNEHLWAIAFPLLSFFMGLGEFFVLYFGGKMVISGHITAGQLLEFTLYLAYIYQPLRWLSSLPRRLGEVSTSLIKIFEILDEKDEIQDADAPAPVNLNGDIVFKDVQFGYKPYEPVLKDINLEVKQGEMIGLVGHSGAGKSTMINLIMRLYDTDSGSISVGGTDIKDMNQIEYRNRIGTVFQETFLFSGTVYDNIAYAAPDASPGQVIAAAKAANAHSFIIKLPDGYNTIIGEDGHNLSGGERQRISIARAVLKNPGILILDEATSALDPETEESIQSALSKLVKGRTTFAIAHRLSTLSNADRLVVIEKGRIAEVGTHRELLLKNGIYAGLVMAQRQTSKLSKDI